MILQPSIQRQAGMNMFPESISSVFTPTKTAQKVDIKSKIGGPPCAHHNKTMSLGNRTVEELTRNNTPSKTKHPNFGALTKGSRLNPTNPNIKPGVRGPLSIRIL